LILILAVPAYAELSMSKAAEMILWDLLVPETGRNLSLFLVSLNDDILAQERYRELDCLNTTAWSEVF
jgi:hypothetical protein